MGGLALPESDQVLVNFANLFFKRSEDNKPIMSVSKVKQNFHAESEGLINKQINLELYASYTYLSMSAYFDRDDIALKGFAKRFREASHEEREHAEKLQLERTVNASLLS